MLFWKPHFVAIFASWQELQVYFRSAPVSSPGKQVHIAVLWFTAMAVRKNPLSEVVFFFLSSPYIAMCFFLRWGVSGNFCTTKQVCGFWGVFILICIPGLNFNFLLKFILNNGATNLPHHGSLWTMMHFHRDTWVFRVLYICFHANICVCLYACVHTCSAGCCWFF